MTIQDLYCCKSFEIFYDKNHDLAKRKILYSAKKLL